MDPQSWPDLIYTYGPYALLPLLLLWVAPRQTKQFLTCKRDEREKQLLCATVTVACWTAAFLSAGYIVAHWPPKVVYAGDLGLHKDPAKFMAVDSGFFVQRSALEDNLGRSTWHYTVVAPNTGEEKLFRFTLQWDENLDHYTDCYMPLSLLEERKINLRPDPDRPGILLYDNDADPQTPPQPFDCDSPAIETTGAGGSILGIGSAHAQAPINVQSRRMDEERLIRWLNSSDPYWRAQGRGQLRNYSDSELRELLQRGNLGTAAQRQIRRELSRRG